MSALVSETFNFDDDVFFSQMYFALEDYGFLSSDEVERLRSASTSSSVRADAALIELGLLSEEELLSFWSEFLSLPVFHEDELPATAVLHEDVPSSFLATNKILPIKLEEATLWIATNDPLNVKAQQALRYLLDVDVKLSLATTSQVQLGLQSLYFSQGLSSGEGTAAELHGMNDAEQLRARANEGPVIKQVNDILATALVQGASDVHFEPDETALSIRFRLDGRLEFYDRLALELAPSILSRIKIMSGLDITERRVPQDGRVSLVLRGRSVDLRVSTLPAVHGESTVLRLLRKDEAALSWEKLGFTSAIQKRLTGLLQGQNGIFLVTGPTGSGKSTTLYSALNRLNVQDKKLVSVEDPVEYRIKGVNQVQVHNEVGLTFANSLRSILRQDPDIIMIGEIRDLETAEISMRASLTGHLVLSTLHTNSSASAFTRLIDMGVAPYLVASCVRGVLSQRLVRKVCIRCKGAGRSQSSSACQDCRGSGYSGRTAICELIEVDEPVREAILQGKSETEIFKSAAQAGAVSLLEDGIRAANEGITSMEEIMSTVGLQSLEPVVS